MSFLHHTEHFFFARRSASAFGLMRIAWAASILTTMLLELPDVIRWYSEPGLVPEGMLSLITRSYDRFSLLDFVTTPTAVLLLYLILLLALACMLVGLWPRLMTIVSVALYFSFHERNPLPLGGGETVLRTLGFLLVVSPGIRACSLERAREQYLHWRETGTTLPALTMPAWPKRLLLWQLLAIYLTSLWDKLLGNMWRWGTAVAVPFHHPHFARFSEATMNRLWFVAPVLNYLTLFFEALWALMLVPKRALEFYLPIRQAHVRRLLLIGGVLFHGGIFVFMNVGSFIFAMMTAYVGLLEQEDFDALRRLFNRRRRGRISIFYDSDCGFCTRSAFGISVIDSLHRVRLVDFHNPILRKKFAQDLSEEELDRSMHIRLPNGRTLHGFVAFRALMWHLPIAWPLAPFLYLPGIAQLGDTLYQWKARTRKKCAHGKCLV